MTKACASVVIHSLSVFFCSYPNKRRNSHTTSKTNKKKRSKRPITAGFRKGKTKDDYHGLAACAASGSGIILFLYFLLIETDEPRPTFCWFGLSTDGPFFHATDFSQWSCLT